MTRHPNPIDFAPTVEAIAMQLIALAPHDEIAASIRPKTILAVAEMVRGPGGSRFIATETEQLKVRLHSVYSNYPMWFFDDGGGALRIQALQSLKFVDGKLGKIPRRRRGV
jgi:hypothetical protein